MQEIWDKYKLWICVGLVAVIALFVWVRPGRADGIGSSPSAIAGPLGSIGSGPWTGFYVGGGVGGAWTKSEFTEQWNGDQSLSKDNLLGTAVAGFDVQPWPGFLVGIMGDITVSDMSKARATGSAMDADWQWFVGVRLGVLPQPKTLVYGYVGYTEAIDGELSFKSNWDKTKWDIAGLTYGGGVEHIFYGNWAARLEYRYTQLGDHTAPNGVIDGLKDGTDVDSGSHAVRAVVLYRFK